MTPTKSLWWTPVAILTIAIVLVSQTAGGSKPSFEVTSVKPSPPGTPGGFFGARPDGRFTGTNITLKMLIGYAWRMRDFQISGGPNWIESDRWNLEAKAAEGTVPPTAGPPDPNVPDTIGLMMQSLLEERFALKSHRETRELPIYVLTVGKDGNKMKAVDPPPRPIPGQAPPAPPPPPPPGPGGGLPSTFTPLPGSIMMGPGQILASAATMNQIVNVLSGRLGRPIVDKTGLKGNFDVRLQFAGETAPGVPFGPGGGPAPPPGAPPAASDPQGPAIFTAVQEQLGLRLESTKGPVDVIVIESVQKPTEN